MDSTIEAECGLDQPRRAMVLAVGQRGAEEPSVSWGFVHSACEASDNALPVQPVPSAIHRLPVARIQNSFGTRADL